MNSRLHYCLLVWGTTTASNIKQLFTLQKRAVRSIDNLPWTESTSPSFIKHGILTLDNLFCLKVAILVHTQINRNPAIFYETYLFKQTNYNLRHQQFSKPKIRTNYGTQKTSYQIPDLLNRNYCVFELAQTIASVFLFKKYLTVYFNVPSVYSYYSSHQNRLYIFECHIFIFSDIVLFFIYAVFDSFPVPCC